MPRTLWLAVICFALIGVLFALRTTIGADATSGRTAPYQTKAVNAPAQADHPPLAKGDKLPSLLLDSHRSAANDAMRILPPQPEQQPVTSQPPVTPKSVVRSPPPEVKEVTNWHWHAGSKITKRSSVVGQR
jgi:hypothetical protein